MEDDPISVDRHRQQERGAWGGVVRFYHHSLEVIFPKK